MDSQHIQAFHRSRIQGQGLTKSSCLEDSARWTTAHRRAENDFRVIAGARILVIAGSLPDIDAMAKIPLIFAVLFLLGLSHIPGMGIASEYAWDASAHGTSQVHPSPMSDEAPCEQGTPAQKAQGCFKICSAPCAATVQIELQEPRLDQQEDALVSVQDLSTRALGPEPHPPKFLANPNLS
jgi:hypothetical protein